MRIDSSQVPGRLSGRPELMTAQYVPSKPRLIWLNIAVFSFTAVASLLLIPWYGSIHGYSESAWIALIAVLSANELAVTAGYHRLWAHRAYEAHWSLKLVLLLFGTMALQNSALVWCSGHRRHHLNVDDPDLDPYAATRGFWFSHIGWMLRRYPSGEQNFENIVDLTRDPLLSFQHKYYVALTIILNIGLPLLIGWMCGDFIGVFLLAGLLRLVLSHHLTFFINSLAHKWGSRPYTDKNTARDNPVLAVLTFGEGYHNFHHLFAHDYRNGVKWWQWDPTKWLIGALEYTGATRKLKRTPNFQIQKAALTMQFSRAAAAIEEAAQRSAKPSRLGDLRETLSVEYESFTSTVNAWLKTKEQWVLETKQSVSDRLVKLDFQTQLRNLELQLQAQRWRLRSLQAQLS